MGTRTSYEPGTFCWVDLMTTDLDAAKEFYSATFGWTFEDSDLDQGPPYTMAQVDGHNVAGLMKSELPPHWNSYIAVESAEDAVKKAADAGANVIQDVAAVGDAGRMAILQDPSGAMVCVWEAGDNPGAGLVNAHGAFSWNDLQTHDVEKAVGFYTEVFGWEVAPVEEDAENERVVVRAGETMNGGIAKLPSEVGENVPPHWMVFFAVDDLEATTKAAEDAGGKRHFGPVDVPGGTFSMFLDPQGGAFAMFSGDLDD